MVAKIAFRMTLLPGQAAEYRRRHDAAWPDLLALLRAAGVRDYSIYHDPADESLFAVLSCDDRERVERLGAEPLMRRWWASMRDIMVTEPDDRPVATDLATMFHLE